MKKFTTYFTFIAIAGWLPQASADTSINGTRIIYPADKREITFTVNNNGKKASLVQSWIDEGNPKDTPDNTTAPFILTPPISVISPEKSQNIRVRYTGEKKLPTEKESLFWVNVLEIPQNIDAPNQLRIGLRTRIKFFFRPENLPIKPDSATEKLSWLIEKKNGKWITIIRNNSPYYITFSSINIKNKNTSGTVELAPQNSMIAPNSNTEYELKPSKSELKQGVNFSIINDYGGQSSFTANTEE
ncbi:fimbrial biogenesis chaperone [Aquitalea aquatica]|uniref:Fimbria/pilus periplasmic chaperone n=1 Tax=Aquitalea aquatica TaxID=3044273 RepID=A0A838XZI4_9NEIS|nr:fimbria/pilus periplasmic chaperone [Aquitalea magnusonii]MBA4707806.1 fimbria/pilus periplasmic chaperone [Aquitalea magnusonii]